jgi:hypothetical protein
MKNPEHMAKLYGALLSAAWSGEPKYYSDIAPVVGLDMNDPNDRLEIGELLGFISRAEVLQHRPMLSSLIIHKADFTSIGDGFYRLAGELGRIRKGEDREEFLIREMNATIATWKSARG